MLLVPQALLLALMLLMLVRQELLVSEPVQLVMWMLVLLRLVLLRGRVLLVQLWPQQD